ncbi:SGNH/GDSL hydrolase family protein [Kribbella sp. NPDC004138]
MTDRRRTPIARLLADGQLTWLFTGDSVTAGDQHTYGRRDYTELFAERIRYELGRISDTVLNTAVSGWTVGDLAAALDAAVLRWSPDIVVIGLGLNDCRAGDAGREQFRATYRELIDRVSATGAHVVLQTPNGALPTTKDGLANNLAGYASDIRDLAVARGATLVDHHQVWARAQRADVMEAWISEGCHPNGAGHVVMAHTLLRTLGLFDPPGHVGQLFAPYVDFASG